MNALADATALPLITRIDEPSGASVRMWAGVLEAPIYWAKYFQQATPTACLHAGCHPGRCVHGPERP
jgi:hypothetical protein